MSVFDGTAAGYVRFWLLVAVLTIVALRLVVVLPILQAIHDQTVALIEAQAQATAAIVEADALLVVAQERTRAAIDRQTALITTGREPASSRPSMRASPVTE